MFQLHIKQEKDLCTFELSWGAGQRLSRSLPFSEDLRSLYQQWQHAYLSYYQTVHIPLKGVSDLGGDLRGKAAGGGTLSTPVDWHARLVEAETHLLYEFHRWLQQGELFDLYRAIADVSRTLPPETPFIDLFLTCHGMELARLPWEMWELGAALATNRKIRIARTPLNIRHETAKPAQKPHRPRILVILGSDPHQNFEEDWQQLRRSLKGIATLPDQPIGWRAEPGQDTSHGIPREPIDRLKDQIKTALVDPQGWDILFFAGHSNETQMTGGELGIAPGVSIRISEIAPQLAIARERGLQFALFNSCSGLSVAEALIDLGLSQVAVMREPVHNRVAQEFLVQFMRALADYKDVHDSLLIACQYLRTEKNLTHPSSHLIPSLFRYPAAKLFQIQPTNLRQQIERWLPKRYEAITLAVLLLLGWQSAVQQWLLDRRILTQSYYHEFRVQGTAEPVPPVLLVQIDEESLQAAGISNPNPIPRRYLADLIRQIATHQPKVVGVDYLLDRPGPDTSMLGQVVKDAIAQQIQFVFAANLDKDKWLEARPEIAHGSVAGDMGLLVKRYVAYMNMPPYPEEDHPPLSYALAQLQGIRQPAPRMQRSPLTSLSYRLGQRWFNPIIDYSLSPNQIYTPISASKLLQSLNPPELKHLAQQVVLIIPGGYAEAGVSSQEGDIFPTPLATRRWYQQENSQGIYRDMTGGEIHAYKLHHFLRQRLVVPVPDLGLILLAAIAGRGIVLISQRYSRRCMVIGLTMGTVLYGLLSLELYFSSAALLLPFILPAAVIWLYVLPPLMKKEL